MYAAAGGLSLAKRQERRNLKKQISSGDPHGHVIRPLKPPSSPLPPIRQSRYELHRSQLNLQQARHRQQQQQLQQQQQHQSHLLTPHQAQYIVQGGEDDDRHHLSAEERSLASKLNGRITSFGSCDLDLYSESQQGKTAWQDRERRNSFLHDGHPGHRSKASEAHKRWMKRNRIHDSSFGGSSSDEEDDLSGGLYGHQSAAANGLLYVGLGTIAIGLVIAFVGTGEKGFKTLELRLIGPSLIGGGLLCCFVRVLLCVCPSTCVRRRNKPRHRHKDDKAGRHLNHHAGFFESGNKNGGTVSENIALVDRTSLPKKEEKISVVTTSVTAAPVPSSSSDNQRPNSIPHQSTSTARDDVLTSTTLFLQHEKQRAGSSKPSLPPPTINIPNYISDSDDNDDNDPLVEVITQGRKLHEEGGNLLDLELQTLDVGSFDICSFKSNTKTPERDIVFESPSFKSKGESKITKPRAPANRSGSAGPSSSSTIRSGLTNPDPVAHMVEEELLLLDKDFETKNKPLENILSSPTKSGEKDDLIQNEIVLSPSKLQQES